uniref:Uncharacterized protein n=1 Tax=Amphimedon queenslandica TaxID=400682 RepID=A0A1X7SH89_AMPQE
MQDKTAESLTAGVMATVGLLMVAEDHTELPDRLRVRGVSKNTVTRQIALGLVEEGKKVGILDIDLCGPSIPHMFSLTGRDVLQGTDGWIPVYVDDTQSLCVMSIGFY